MQVNLKKLAIVDEYLVYHCWMLTHDHHLDDRLSLSHVSRRRRRSRIGALNDVHSRMARPRVREQLYMTQVTEATSKTNFRKIFCPHIWRPLKISPSKMEKPRIGQSSTIVQIFTSIGTRYLSPRKKKYYFPYSWLPWGLPSHAINF